MNVTSTNPATGELRTLGIRETSVAEVQALTQLASSALNDFSQRPLVWRAEMLQAMADELEEDGEQLVAIAMEETALPRPRLEDELRRTAFQLRFFADIVTDGAFLDVTIDHATNSPMGPLPDLRRIRIALGVVAVFGSSNFPFAFSVPGGDTASALAAGCPVVIKAHPAHPATSGATFDALLRAARRCGAPEGMLSLVFGFDAGTALVEAPDVSAVGFTGSVIAGRALWGLANARPVPIPFYGELGAANPLIVTDRAARERAIEIGAGIAGSMTLGVGQFCTKPGLLFVPTGAEGDSLVSTLVGELEKLPEFTMLSVGIARNFRVGVEAIGAVTGARALLRQELGDEAATSAQLFEVGATTFTEPGASALREECFGPLALVVRYDSPAQLRNALLVSEPALTFSVFVGANDPDGAELIDIGSSRAGRVIMNTYPTGVGVSWSMQHGGPWPSTTSPTTTSVGAGAIDRWLRPVTFQSVPDGLLAPALQESNPLGIPRRVDGSLEISPFVEESSP
jgi:NADP-dependent aldehyde dehydrogenase